MYLRIEHRKKDFKKTWKIESHHSSTGKSFSLGHSRHADIRLDKAHAGITGVFEFKEGHWSYTDLNKPDNNVAANRFITIEGPTVIPLKEGELHVWPFARQIQLFSPASEEETEKSKKETFSALTPWIWLVWRRNGKVWYSEFVSPDKNLCWPHHQKPLQLKPSAQWQDIENEGVTLSYKLTTSPETKGFMTGAFKTLLDPSLRPYLIGAFVACLLTGLLSFMGAKKTAELPVAANPPSESTVIRLEPPKRPPVPPKNAVAKALAQTRVPKTASSAPQRSARKALGQVFSMIGKHSLKNIAVGTAGAKTLALTTTTTPQNSPASAKTFKVLGSLGSGTGLHASQFAKNAKEGGVGLNQGGVIGGSELGHISQGNVGQGDLGLLHKESQVTGGLDREVIAKYIQGQKGKILFCYERQLSANPSLFGKVSVKFQIAPGGEVETSNITESTLSNESVEACLLQLIAQWRFPKPEGGVRVLVSYPFVFKSLN